VNAINNSLELIIKIKTQQCQLIQANHVLFESKLSSAKNGVGETYGSECTPRGKHIIRAKIGFDSPKNTVFVARRATNEIFTSSIQRQYPQRDWILTRIMWLSGLEVGKNRLGNVDTMRRYIYIHGCPDDNEMGKPSSHGCIKMHNSDVVELFNLVDSGTLVNII